tara:strand:- start:1793 stop:3373 length:1581 start_codon:yes stop_codon:yes gene_type:complete
MFIRKFSLFVLILIINFNCLSQLTDDKIRGLNIEIINKVQYFNECINLSKIRDLDKRMMISNDHILSNQSDSIILIEDYIKLISNNSSNKYSLTIIDINPTTSIENNNFTSEVFLKKTIQENLGDCSENQVFISNVLRDTIFQKAVFTSSFKDKIWKVKLNRIETINPRGRKVLIVPKGNKNYFDRFGLKQIVFLDTTYSLIPSKNLNYPIYFVKDPKKSFNEYENYYDFYTNNKPKSNSCNNIASYKLPKQGSNGYVEAGIGLDFSIFNRLNSDFSIIPEEEIISSVKSINSLGVWGQYVYYLKQPYRLNVGFGITNNSFIINSSFVDHSDVYQAVDPDGSYYYRKSNYENFVENFMLDYISIPISLGLDVELGKKFNQINKRLMLSLNYAFTPMMNTNAESTRSSTVKYSGNYPDLFNITISENGVYDFGTFNLTNTITEMEKNNTLSHSISIGTKAYINNIVFSFMGNYLLAPKTIFALEDKTYISINNNELNSLLANSDRASLHSFNLLFKIGYVINGKKEF